MPEKEELKELENDTAAHSLPYIIVGALCTIEILAAVGYMAVSGCSSLLEMDNIANATTYETTIEETTLENDNGFTRTRG